MQIMAWEWVVAGPRRSPSSVAQSSIILVIIKCCNKRTRWHLTIWTQIAVAASQTCPDPSD